LHILSPPPLGPEAGHQARAVGIPTTIAFILTELLKNAQGQAPGQTARLASGKGTGPLGKPRKLTAWGWLHGSASLFRRHGIGLMEVDQALRLRLALTGSGGVLLRLEDQGDWLPFGQELQTRPAPPITVIACRPRRGWGCGASCVCVLFHHRSGGPRPDLRLLR
jgi:hypothetical protein